MPSRTSRAEQLLACTLTYRDAEVRTTPLCSEHSTAERALEEWKKVLLHEAHEAMAQPLRALPEHLYLHPVDVDTDEPGIVDKTPEQEEVVRRYDPASVPRVSYGTRTARRAAPSSPLPAAAPAVVSHATVADAERSWIRPLCSVICRPSEAETPALRAPVSMPAPALPTSHFSSLSVSHM